jgi:hypothetical protein
MYFQKWVLRNYACRNLYNSLDSKASQVLPQIMRRVSRILLSVVLVTSAVVSVAVDWNTTHLFNPEWHPHAKFHDAVMLWLLSGMSIMALWLLWRRSAEPALGYTVAMLVPVIFWSPFFFITLLVPGTSLQADLKEPPPMIGSIPIYPNVVVATISVILALTGYGLYWASRSEPGGRTLS